MIRTLNAQTAFTAPDIGLQLGLSIPLDRTFLDSGANVSIDGWIPIRPLNGFPRKGAMRVGANLEYIYTGQDYIGNLQLIGIGLGAGYLAPLGEFGSIGIELAGGYYIGSYIVYSWDTGGAPYFTGKTEASIRLGDSFTLDIGLRYSHFASAPVPLLQVLTPSIGVKYRGISARALQVPRLSVSGLATDAIFPALRKLYDTKPIGALSLRNDEGRTAKDIAVTLFIPGYTDAPTECLSIPSLSPGETVAVPLYAGFNAVIHGIKEKGTAQASIRVSYSIGKDKKAMDIFQTIQFYDGNALTWSDTRAAGAFVTAKDSLVIDFARRAVASAVGAASNSGSSGIASAIAVLEAMDCYGLRYATSPTGSYVDIPADGYAIDFLQYPRQTLEFRGGDCADMAILYAACLEALGIRTAFITVPGHIFLAFDPGKDVFTVDYLRKRGFGLIQQGDTSWMPVEITMLSKGFLEAWREGVGEWEQQARDRELLPLAETFSANERLESSGASPTLDLDRIFPDMGGLGDELRKFRKYIISDEETELKKLIAASSGHDAARYANELGILYARCGLLEDAVSVFENEYRGARTIASYVNLGNVAYLKDEFGKAVSYYREAMAIGGERAAILMGIAAAEYARENFGIARTHAERAALLDPRLGAEAARFSVAPAPGKPSNGPLAKRPVDWEEE